MKAGQGGGIYRQSMRIWGPRWWQAGWPSSGVSPGQPLSSEAVGRKLEQSRNTAGQASGSRARDEVGNQHSGAAPWSEEIPRGALARWERGGLEPWEPGAGH